MKTREELEGMSKVDIDAYGDSIGLNLDRRKKKEKLIEKVLAKQEEMARDAEAAAAEVVVEGEDDVEDTPQIAEIPTLEPSDFPIKKGVWVAGGIVLLLIIIFLIVLL